MGHPRVLVVTGGHPFEAGPFAEVFTANDAITAEHVTHPEARRRLHPDRLDADVIAFYDMPGLRFTGADPPVELEPVPAEVLDGFAALASAGVGMVFVHHAIAGWPSWSGYAEMVGGRFHYRPGSLGGRDWPDSGYAFDVTHTVEVLDPDHPICAGLPERFELTDELYCFPVLTERVVPLLRTTAPMTDDVFWSADLAIRGRREARDGWSHPPGSDLVGWVTSTGRAPICYLQFGDGPQTYADPAFRQVLANALAWAGSTAAGEWAAERHERAAREATAR